MGLLALVQSWWSAPQSAEAQAVTDRAFKRAFEEWLRDNSATSWQRDAWIRGDEIRIFFRRGVIRHIAGRRCRCFDIANIWVPLRGRGTFTRVLPYILSRLSADDYDMVWIENVLEERFARWWARQPGWIQEQRDWSRQVNFYRWL